MNDGMTYRDAEVVALCRLTAENFRVAFNEKASPEDRRYVAELGALMLQGRSKAFWQNAASIADKIAGVVFADPVEGKKLLSAFSAAVRKSKFPEKDFNHAFAVFKAPALSYIIGDVFG